MTTDAVQATQSVLDRMVAEVLARKAAPKGLSPVGSERAGPLHVAHSTISEDNGGPIGASRPLAGPIPADFPFDFPLQEIALTIAEVRRQLAHLEAGCAAIEAAVGVTAVTPPVTKEQGKLAATATSEAASQAAFEADLAAKTERAQAEAFGDAETEIVEPETIVVEKVKKESTPAVAVAPPTWTCPIHHKAKAHVSPRGRHYLACTVCDSFQRPEGR